MKCTKEHNKRHSWCCTQLWVIKWYIDKSSWGKDEKGETWQIRFRKTNLDVVTGHSMWLASFHTQTIERDLDILYVSTLIYSAFCFVIYVHLFCFISANWLNRNYIQLPHLINWYMMIVLVLSPAAVSGILTFCIFLIFFFRFSDLNENLLHVPSVLDHSYIMEVTYRF